MAKNASASQDKLVDIFNRIEHFFRRLEIYTSITPTRAMRCIIVKIMVEVLTILAIATKEAKRGRFSESMWCISVYLTILADMLFRKVLYEVDGKQRRRGQPGEVGQIDTRRGTDGGSGAAKDDSQRR